MKSKKWSDHGTHISISNIKPTNLQPRNKHIERSSNKTTEMNNPETISSSLFQSLTNPDLKISTSVIHFVNGQIWKVTPSHWIARPTMMAFMTWFQRAQSGLTHFMAVISSEVPLKNHNQQRDQLSSPFPSPRPHRSPQPQPTPTKTQKNPASPTKPSHLHLQPNS